ncbi:MAG: wax ester/triacylglycerol synthase family O-acyltransferase [Actinomycetota bacterium]
MEGSLDRLTPLDVSNLRVESHGLPMNVAAIAVLESRPLLDASGNLALDALCAAIERRLHRAPRLRKKLFVPPFAFGAPIWVDDARFDIRTHVKTRAVPAPGDEETLLRTCVELNGQPLDRMRPLWKIWFLTGLRDGTVVMLIRFHHVLADGIAGLMLLGSLFETYLDAPEPEPRPWNPRPVPTLKALFIDNVRARLAAARAVSVALGHPRPFARRLGVFGRQLVQALREGRAPRTSFNRPVGTHQRLMLARADLDRVKSVARAHNATVNDVVLSAMAAGAGALLASRGELARDLVLKVSVAASVRAPDSGTAGNLVGIMIVPVPVAEPDPIRRLERVAAETAARKRLPPYQPSGRFMQRWMVGVMNRQRLVNLLTSNLPGPPQPMYFAGARILEVSQVGVVQGNLALTVGVLSYAGRLNLNIMGDAEAVPDLSVFVKGLADEIKRLCDPGAVAA